ncbi:glycoside hydrolase family 31 protein [Actinopolymorpha alba]|uniref:glycoside hydrolase family 31 protein n=1 Tax=Actinopolymorpha alba TaxID=533267 RepID=UPI0003796A97|nr:glycoside hydrolase family 31 protein [Actinopolymorpha alba]
MQPSRVESESGDAAPSLLTGWWRHLRLRARENVFDRIRALYKSFQLIGWRNSVRAILYALYRARIDRRLPQPGAPTSRTPGDLRNAEEIPGGARFSFANASLDIRFLAHGGVFVGWDGAPPTPSYALGAFGGNAGGAEPDPASDSRLAHEGDSWSVSAGDLTVVVDRSGGLTFRTRSEEAGHADGSLAEAGVAVRYDPPPQWDGSAWAHRSVLDSDAAVMGLGGRSTPLDRRGHTYHLWNTDPGGTYTVGDDPLCLSIPVYLVVSDAGCHLAFYDNSHAGTVEVGEEVVARLNDGDLRYYVFTGTPAAALEQYTTLTGRPALPPRWALGYQQCRWGYGSEAAVRRIVEQFAEHDLPLSAIWLDIDHLVEHRPFAVDEARYPDLGGLTADLAERNVHVVVIADPGIGKVRGEPTYESGRAADAYCRDDRGRPVTGVVWPGWTVFPDFTAERARSWWSGLYEGYVKLGVAGFWHDMNEPSVFAAWGDGTLPLSTRHDLDGRGGDHREAHNVFALLLNHAGFEGVRRFRPDERPFLLSRAGFAGLQRYAGTWSGDIGTSWDGLRISLTFTLGLGTSGVPYSGPDIGGFDGHPSDELYVRWFQLGAYLPFFRVHCAAALPAREPWALGPEVLERVRPALRERYELLPYWYTLAWEAHRTGAPYVRPLLWADPADAALRWVDDEFLLGDALLIAPVLEEGARERIVRLPQGRWYDRRTGEVYDGPGHVTIPAPLDVTPVLVRAGTVLPVEKDGQLSLEAYLPEDASEGEPGTGGVLVTDRGDGYAEPVEERFTIRFGPDGEPVIDYTGPAETLPYPVRWYQPR